MGLGGFWGILTLIVVIWVIVDLLPQKRSILNKAFWVVIAVIFGLLGALAYLVFGRR